MSVLTSILTMYKCAYMTGFFLHLDTLPRKEDLDALVSGITIRYPKAFGFQCGPANISTMFYFFPLVMLFHTSKEVQCGR